MYTEQEIRDAADLREHVVAFMLRHRITCPEDIYQSDEMITEDYALSLIEELRRMVSSDERIQAMLREVEM